MEVPENSPSSTGRTDIDAIRTVFDEQSVEILEPRLPPDLESHDDAVRQALRTPIGSVTIPDLVRSQSRVLLLVDDWTRDTPRQVIVDAILRDLEEGGVQPDQLEIVCAGGTHYHKAGGFLKLPQPWDQCRVAFHDCDDANALVFLGVSSRGTPIWVNRCVVEADVVIGVGNITAHVFCGFGGGGKILMPGVAGRDTINANHSLMVAPGCRTGQIDGNPSRQDIDEIAKMAGLDFVANSIVNYDRRVVGFVAGDPILAHRKGVELFEKHYGISQYTQADLLVVGVIPSRNASLSKAKRALCDMRDFVRPDGQVILIANCEDGWGPEEDVAKALIPSVDLLELEYKEIVSRVAARNDELRVLLQVIRVKELLERNSLTIVSRSLGRDRLAKYGIRVEDTLEEALSSAAESILSDTRVNYVPFGDLAYPCRGPRSAGEGEYTDTLTKRFQGSHIEGDTHEP